jgi:hypothetical protein
MDSLKGWRTVLVGAAVALGPAAVTYFAGVDWTKLIGANAGMFVSGALMIILRGITTTPIGQDK